jgi:GR25 family glycosyltransferase involved in LPS biosynthesis
MYIRRIFFLFPVFGFTHLLILLKVALKKNDFSVAEVKATPSTTHEPLIESFVISLDPRRIDDFQGRNENANLHPVWFPGVDGHHQDTLDQWGKLIGQPPLNASHFIRGLQEDKDKYASPHAVGCYLSHWYLLRMLHYRAEQMHPELYMIFEDDTTCIPNVVDATLKVTQKLPSDWDILFLSGKPFTWYQDPGNHFVVGWTDEQVESEICHGRFGQGSSPLSPHGTRRLSSNPEGYWKILYMLNTHSYVVNPKNLRRLYKITVPKKHIPIDVLFADAMEARKIQAYMTTQQFCSTENPSLAHPIPWSGYLGFVRNDGNTQYHWRNSNFHFFNCSF